MKFESLTLSVQEKYDIDSHFISSACDLEEWDTIQKLCAILLPSTAMIGEYVLSEEQCMDIESLGKKLFGKFLNSNCSKKSLNLLEEKVLFYAAVYFTQKLAHKTQSGNDESDDQLWNNLYSQFGYDELNNPPSKQKVYSAMRDIIKENSRYFSERGHKYYNTLKAQAMVPETAYMELINIANNFYERNLEYQYDEAENAFLILAENIGKRIGKDLTDSDIRLGAKIWQLSSNVKELLINEPVYMAAIFDAITAKIDMLRRGDTPKFSANNRWDSLIQKWFEQKSQEERETMRAARAKRIGQRIATRREAIHPRYSVNDDDFCLTIPGIRLPEITQQPKYRLLQNGHMVESGKLSIYGDEMCYTTREHICYLSDNDEISWDTELNFQIEIVCGETVIYDSRADLFREYLVFNSNGEESQIRKCENGDITLIAAQNARIAIDDPDDRFFEHSMHFQYRRFYIPLQSVQQIVVNQRNIMESDEKKQVRCFLSPNPIDGIQVRYNEESCVAFSEAPVLHISVSAQEDLIRYQLSVDSEVHQLQEFFNGSLLAEVHLPSTARFCRTVSLKEFTTGKVVYSAKYIILPKFNYRFSKPYFLNRGESGTITIHMSGNTKTEKFNLLENQESLEIKLMDSLIAAITVPLIDISADGDNTLFWPKNIWSETIPQNTFIRISRPKNIEVCLMLGVKQVPIVKNKNIFELGNMLVGCPKNDSPQSLWASIRSEGIIEEIHISDIYLQPSFATPPVARDESVLIWEPEGSYVGPENPDFLVEVENDTVDGPWQYREGLKRDVMEKRFNCRPGRYECKVFLRNTESKSPFQKLIPDKLIWATTITIDEIAVEDNPEDRFINSYIRLTGAKFYSFNTKRVESARIGRYDALIDEIEYSGFDDSDGALEKSYHFYVGTLFFQMPDGKWCTMNSTEDNPNFEHINPVRFCVTDNDKLLVFNADGEQLQLNATRFAETGRVRILNRKELSLSKEEQIKLLPFADSFDYREEMDG